MEMPPAMRPRKQIATIGTTMAVISTARFVPPSAKAATPASNPSGTRPTGWRSAIVGERDRSGPYGSIGELTERVQLQQPVAEALATSGAFASLGPDRRQAL
ncbi:hypothetical protein [Amycolatopsis sp. NPDC004169]|uniref:helix-hairpin-helix domain-containing protein n=1 Tax=Amycolatopsis sp. NPDC004169 TaxID=3154453 RepID=UPI0033BF1A9A